MVFIVKSGWVALWRKKERQNEPPEGQELGHPRAVPLSYVGGQAYDRGGRGGGVEEPNQQRWPNAPPCGANCVHHSCGQSCFSEGQGGSSLNGAGAGTNAPGLPGLLAQTGGSGGGAGGLYQFIR